MQRQLFTASMMAVGICALLIVASASDEPGQNDSPNDRNPPARNDRDTDRPRAGQEQGATRGKTVRASEIIGMAINNPQGESVGQIDDLVIDATGQVAYLAVTYEGRPDARNQMFAVPFQAFEVKHDANADQCTLVLNVTEQQLEQAEGFDANHWPDFSDLQFTSGIDELYGVQRHHQDHADEQHDERPGSRP